MDVTGYAFIAGGGSGIGRACCIAFAKDGAAGIMVADINKEAALLVATESKAAATNPSFRAEAAEIDVTKEDSIGVQNARQVADVDVQEFSRFMDVNVTGTLIITSVASAVMRLQEPRPNDRASPLRGVTRGAIVLLGSAASYIASPDIVQYTASKHAVLGLTKNAALDNVKHDIRVNCVCPTWVDTPMVQRALKSIDGLEDFITSAVPMKRLAAAEEVADAVIFLSSPRSSYVTGCGFIIDGGTTLTAHV